MQFMEGGAEDLLTLLSKAIKIYRNLSISVKSRLHMNYAYVNRLSAAILNKCSFSGDGNRVAKIDPKMKVSENQKKIVVCQRNL